MNEGRIHAGIARGVPWGFREEEPTVSFIFEGQSVTGVRGEPVAMSLWAEGYRILGWNEETGAPRSVVCAIGHCFECRMIIGGQRDQRACLTPVSEGLAVERQPRPDPLVIDDGMTRR